MTGVTAAETVNRGSVKGDGPDLSDQRSFGAHGAGFRGKRNDDEGHRALLGAGASLVGKLVQHGTPR